MATGTGDATADLLALLRAHCPDVAEETLAKLAGAAAALDAAGDGDGRPLRWSSLTLGGLEEIRTIVTTVRSPVQVVSAVLDFVAGILEVISKLLIAIPDPFRALILAAYELLKSIIDDLLGSGAYVYFDAPGLLSNTVTLRDMGVREPELPRWVAGDRPLTPDRPADGFEQWAHRFRQSFDDAGDQQRPMFSDGAPVEALFIVATAPQLPDLAALASSLAQLLDLKAFGKAWDQFASTFPELPDDPDVSRLRFTPVHPDWKSWRLRDIAPQADYPLRFLEKLPDWLLALLLDNAGNIVDLIKALVDAVRAKVDLLREIIEVLDQIIDALNALTGTGLHALVVVTDAGVDGLVDAFLEAENRPGTVLVDPDTGEVVTPPETGVPMTAFAVAGVCLLAGTSEVVPANALPVWALFGQGQSIDQAYAALTADWAALEGQYEKAVEDTEALATDAWKGLEQGRDSPSDLGLEGLWGGLTDTFDEQGEAVLGALGLTQEEADELARSNRTGLVTGLEQAMAEGTPLDPVVVAHLEATRRARRRGSRSLAMAYGSRRPAPAAEEGKPS
jgi:hypothetical protein